MKFSFSNIKTKPKILFGVLSPMIFLLVLGGVAATNVSAINNMNKWVNHTHEVLGASSNIVSSAVDIETGMRGYLLAGAKEFLDPYHSGEVAAYETIEALKEVVSDNPKQVARLTEAEGILRDWQVNVTEPAIQLRRDIGDSETMNDIARIVSEARGKTYFDGFRDQVATFVGREQSLLETRGARKSVV